MNLENMTAEDREALKKQIKEAEMAEKNAVKARREDYKMMVNEAVTEVFIPLTELSRQILDVKKLVFDTFDTVMALKAELYGIKDSQRSHTFTSLDGTVSITMGWRVNDNYDDTVGIGIEKVKTYLQTLAKDADSASLVDTIWDLLKRDDKGNLKASRVIELSKLANRVGNEEFSDGIRIIQDAYKPVKSCQFIEVKFKDEHGKEHSLPLSISAFDI